MDENKNFTRETAKLCPLDILLKGEYVVLEGWQPNYVDVGFDKISRINIMGVVVEKSSPNQFFIDDGFASIKIVDFNNKNLSNLNIGDPVLVIGRPRKVNGELFISSEIIAFDQLKENPLWLTKRKHELALLKKKFQEEIDKKTILNKSFQKQTTESESKNNLSEEKIEKITSQQLTGDDIVDFIKKKDTGDGVLIDEIIQYFGTDSEEVINTLLSMGEIYEFKPGQVKFLE